MGLRQLSPILYLPETQDHPASSVLCIITLHRHDRIPNPSTDHHPTGRDPTMSIRIRRPTTAQLARLRILVLRYEQRYGIRWIMPDPDMMSELQVAQHIASLTRRLPS